MRKLITNIHTLSGILTDGLHPVKGEEMGRDCSISNAYLHIVDGKIENYGAMSDLNARVMEDVSEVVDGSDRLVAPAFVDPHTHLVFAEPRHHEYTMRLKGATYQEIAESGGGILNSAHKLRKMEEEELYERAVPRLNEAMHWGTGAIEIKSGYGLSPDAELKMLRVIKRLKYYSPIPVKATFLGAHALPPEFKTNREGYIKLLTEKMLPVIKEDELADFVDVFCETNYFTVDETRTIVEAASKLGLKAKLHVNQFTSLGAIKMAVEAGALSVDHLEVMTVEDIEALKNGNTLPTLLPACSFFLGIDYAPARKLIENGLPIALGSDFNPGSSPTSNMQLVQSIACTQMKITPEEALMAATQNAACALDMQHEIGSITKGKRANLILTKKGARDLSYFTYNFGANDVDQVWIDGEKIKSIDTNVKSFK